MAAGKCYRGRAQLASRRQSRSKQLLLQLRCTCQRRFNSQKPGHSVPSSSDAAAGSKSAPRSLLNSTWLEPLAVPFRAYGRAQQRSPYIVQLSASLVIYFLGDLSAQLVAQKPNPADSPGSDYLYDPGRGLRAMIIGGLSSIPSYHWFLFLGRHFNYSSHARSLAVKIVVNQTCFTPIFNSYFFGMHALLSGAGPAETVDRIKNTVPRSMVMSLCLWPAVTAFNFTYVPVAHRNVFAGVVAIGWQTYLSWLNSRAARKAGSKS